MALTDLIPLRRHDRKNQSMERRRGNDPFARLQGEINRLFDDFLPTAFHRSASLTDWGGSWDFMPDVDVRETKKEILVSVELPGVEEKDLDVRLDGKMLTIRGEKREEKSDTEGDWYHSECHYGSFSRSIPLNADVDSTKIDASFKKGILKVKLPKSKTDKTEASRIDVKAG